MKNRHLINESTLHKGSCVYKPRKYSDFCHFHHLPPSTIPGRPRQVTAPFHRRTSSSIKSSGRAWRRSARVFLDDTNVDGWKPSLEPTVLKNPAENPPVKAPWNRCRPRLSRTVWSSNAGGRRLAALPVTRAGNRSDTCCVLVWVLQHRTRSSSKLLEASPHGRTNKHGVVEYRKWLKKRQKQYWK